MESSAPQGACLASEPDDVEEDPPCLASLPDALTALVWPPELLFEGLCVGNRGLTRALLSAPGLDLAHREMGWRGAEAAAGTLRSMTGLRRLDLSFNGIGGEGAGALAGALAGMTGLESLVLKRNELGSVGAGVLAPHLPGGLVHLDLHSNELGGEGFAALGPSLRRLTRLRELFIGENEISAGGVGALGAWLEHLTALETLDLSWNELDIDGCEALGPVLQPLAPSLRVLNASGNNLGDGVKALVPFLLRLTCLEKLDLSSSFFREEGGEALGELRQLTGLRELDLRYSAISFRPKQVLRDLLSDMPRLLL